MFSSGALRGAAGSVRSATAASSSLRVGAPLVRTCVQQQLRGVASGRMLEGRRYITAYGYTQAKALVYSKYGEPKDVLR